MSLAVDFQENVFFVAHSGMSGTLEHGQRISSLESLNRSFERSGGGEVESGTCSFRLRRGGFRRSGFDEAVHFDRSALAAVEREEVATVEVVGDDPFDLGLDEWVLCSQEGESLSEVE